MLSLVCLVLPLFAGVLGSQPRRTTIPDVNANPISGNLASLFCDYIYDDPSINKTKCISDVLPIFEQYSSVRAADVISYATFCRSKLNGRSFYTQCIHQLEYILSRQWPLQDATDALYQLDKKHALQLIDHDLIMHKDFKELKDIKNIQLELCLTKFNGSIYKDFVKTLNIYKNKADAIKSKPNPPHCNCEEIFVILEILRVKGNSLDIKVPYTNTIDGLEYTDDVFSLVCLKGFKDFTWSSLQLKMILHRSDFKYYTVVEIVSFLVDGQNIGNLWQESNTLYNDNSITETSWPFMGIMLLFRHNKYNIKTDPKLINLILESKISSGMYNDIKALEYQTFDMKNCIYEILNFIARTDTANWPKTMEIIKKVHLLAHQTIETTKVDKARDGTKNETKSYRDNQILLSVKKCQLVNDFFTRVSDIFCNVGGYAPEEKFLYPIGIIHDHVIKNENTDLNQIVNQLKKHMNENTPRVFKLA